VVQGNYNSQRPELAVAIHRHGRYHALYRAAAESGMGVVITARPDRRTADRRALSHSRLVTYKSGRLRAARSPFVKEPSMILYRGAGGGGRGAFVKLEGSATAGVRRGGEVFAAKGRGHGMI